MKYSVLVGLLSFLAIFVLAMVFLMGSQHGARQVRERTEIFELQPETEAKAKKLFADYKDGKIKERFSLKLLDACTTEVAVMADFGGGVCGFVRSATPIRQFWVTADGLRMYRFDADHIFVIIKDWNKSKLSGKQFK